MPRSSIIAATYFHLPGGSDGPAFETLYQGSLKPFLSGLYRFPQVPLSVYLSGPLVERLESEHPEYLMLLKEMVGRKQVEILGGGWANPCFPLIPQTDRLGQIEELTTTVRRMLGKRPMGCILARGLWEQQLASTLQAAGMDFTFLADTFFKSAGLETDAPRMTEDQGRRVAVIPVAEAFSSSLPSDSCEAAKLLREASAGKRLLTILLPGDAFFDPALDNSQAETAFASLFSAMRDMAVDMDFTLPSRYLKGLKILEPAYFRDFPSREFLIQSPETGRLYARMQYTQLQVNQLKGDKARKKQARLELWKAQDSLAYFPAADALVASRVRAWAYRSLMDAERMARGKSGFMPSILPVDYDFDGSPEYLCQASDLNAYVHLSGGRLVELDAVALGWNSLNAVDPEWGPCLFDDLIILEGSGEILRPRAVYEAEEPSRSGTELKLAAEFSCSSAALKASLRVEKRYSFRKTGITLSYAVVNIGTRDFRGRYGLAGSLSLMLREGFLRTKVKNGQARAEASGNEPLGFHGEAEGLEMVDERGKSILDLQAAQACDLRVAGVTRSAEDSTEPCVSVEFSWPLSLVPGQRFESSMQLGVHARRLS